jgi:D-alanyl-D-alanine carboxypeptidase
MQTPRFDLDKQGLLEQLKLSIEHTLCKFQAPGAAVAIYINGQPFLETGVGYQDIEGKIPPLDTPVTLQQLLSHTSGLPDYGGTSTYVNAQLVFNMVHTLVEVC